MAEEINKKELTKEQMEKAMACKTADELMALAKAEGYELTKEEAEAFLAEVSEVELSDEVLQKAAGGYYRPPCIGYVCQWRDVPEYGPVAPTEVDPVSKAIRAGAVWG